MAQSLDKLRERLDGIDASILDALANRQTIVSEIGILKASKPGMLRDSQREEDLLTELVKAGRNAGLDPHFVTRLFREIIDHSIRRQEEHLTDRQDPDRRSESITVGYQGTDGAYSHLAAQKHFAARDAEVRFEGFGSFREMLEAVHDAAIDYAMLPIDNTTAGSINEAYDLLARMNLALVGEEIGKIDHCLLALESVPLSRIRRIYSHPQALFQCSEFLRGLKHCHVESFEDTALAAQQLRRDQDLSEAAIASEEAARLYDLKILKRDIANQKENYTRFVVVAKEPARFDSRIPCKTSVIFATRHEEGALLSCLNVLALHHLNLTKLESRPRPNMPWEYLFYVDFEGNVSSSQTEEGLRALGSETSFLKILGSYPARTGKESRPAEPRPQRVPAVPTESTPQTEPSVLEMLEKKPYKLVSRTQRSKDTLIQVGSVVIGAERPVIIAGPCSVESRDQVFACAEKVKELGGDILRGGCFKPRTSPYAFQGLGYEGLDLLEEAGRAFGLPIVTEVLHPADVAKVAAKADILQLGARNMQNFALLKEVGRVDRPVLLKRGMMASIDEWLGAAEYILAHGNQQVILCERGIRTFETATRNTLDLSAVPVARERTHLPIIVDPSHACGTWRWVPAMSLAALAVGAQGVMVEIHPKPEEALSDGPQALDFPKFTQFMGRIQTHRDGAGGGSRGSDRGS